MGFFMHCAPLDFTPLDKDRHFKVLFVYPNARMPWDSMEKMLIPQLGLAVLSSCLERIGVETTLCDLTTVPFTLWTEVLRARLKSDQPDLVAITANSMHWPYTVPIIKGCKQLGVAHILGGPHPTVHPEGVMEEADALVVGEGEGALMDVVRALAGGQSIAGIPNTWARTEEGHVVQSECRRLIDNLDDLPFPDWQLFDRIHYQPLRASRKKNHSDEIRNLIRASIEGSRGCPYQCAYCSNSAQMKSYQGKGTWRREKSPRRIIEELKAFRERFGVLNRVFWVDEVFMTSTERVAELSGAYKQEINVPFTIADRPEMITEQKLKMLADAGLDFISIGFESGDENIRKAVLNRNTKVDLLKQAFLLPKKYGVRTHAFTMVGLPGQDEESMMLTWKFLREVKPDSAQCTVFRPMRGTALYDECVTQGRHDPRNDTQPWQALPVIKHDILEDHTIIRYQRMLAQYAAARGIGPVIAFHLGRRCDWACRLLLRAGHRWSLNQDTGLVQIRNMVDVITNEVRSWFERKPMLPLNLATAAD